MTKPTVQATALGQTSVAVDSQQLPIGAWTSRGARLLFFIAADRSPIHRDEIGLLMWPDFSPSRLASIFHATRWRMNNALGQRNLFRRDGVTSLYCFDDTRVEIIYDVSNFEQAIEMARELPKEPEALQAWKDALALYGGPYLPGFYEDWALDRRRQLSLMYLEALTTAAELSIAMNDVDGAIRLYRRVLDEGEYADDAYYRLLQLLISQNQLGEAKHYLRQYQREVAPLSGLGVPG